MTNTATAAGKSSKSAASAADTKEILIPNAAHSTEESAVETMKDRSGTHVNKNLEKEKRKLMTAAWTPKWVAERLGDQQEERSIRILNAWTHHKKGQEATRETVTTPTRHSLAALEHNHNKISVEEKEVYNLSKEGTCHY
ncbi:hypothetical protein SERLADRAFT_438229 [Serpula lacrymans var. lacrymans S7.9]|uniref:Uncharacterized protein n=1 Tax=Serpula lacrymans var. lacrymans (strain S7.9) TaxID=578457 RepID=F8NXD3_SERL9|nr:uncharacterized protein SERLADRAFT_438229 [Serpula lacrymans var. lacrymans S7.9]EGO24605.1 hypothetical protein SERLADRAFT_438229 [Serpula lacrymans var. lacrymans S7.9]